MFNKAAASWPHPLFHEINFFLFHANILQLSYTFCNFLYYFWYWEEEYIDILIERNLVDVRALLASIKAIDQTSVLIARLEDRHETRCEKRTSPVENMP